MASAKNWMVSHIRALFEARPDEPAGDTWVCVIRDDTLVVVHRFNLRRGDREVMRSYLPPGHVPPWLATSNAVQKHWSALERLAMPAVAERRDHMFPQPWTATDDDFDAVRMNFLGHRYLVGS